jgi:secreted Zn-dependent insulinase-like peptidase
MHAVNQEFEMHKDQDGYRQYMVDKQLSNPEHPNQRFTIGNLATLGKVKNEALVKWYQAHYSANLMTIAVFTAHPADDIKDLVAQVCNLPRMHLAFPLGFVSPHPIPRTEIQSHAE